VDICHDITLEPMTQIDEHSVLLVAVFFDSTRLIDNHYLLTPMN